ncbi:MAG: membrane protein insertion efficiency factor YidD [Candidatus Omnitrophica bacterium]|nr:membrane protein insertion efficiency factor YidD [Candidatus Omnitrophota bacterium]MDD5430091.1 membrane protein insertion efficiency factor YidD [Candidatus Omnitrophota bacterium]
MRRLLLVCLNWYQRFSKLFRPHCIYIPTCSEYAKQAFSRYPLYKAFYLTGRRILRCNPLSKGGLDPLP